jgi:hypothetical protein
MARTASNTGMNYSPYGTMLVLPPSTLLTLLNIYLLRTLGRARILDHPYCANLELTIIMQGFIPYFYSHDPDAKALTVRHQVGRSSLVRRSHAIFEARNFMCAHIKRDDPISRRLVQYLSMQSHQLVVLVRDAETGKLLIRPPEDQRWLWRQKSGLDRAAKNDWTVLKSIGADFFEGADKYRRWHFSSVGSQSKPA